MFLILRMVVERSLGLLKNRFQKLKTSMLKQKIKDVPIVVVVACVFHNTCFMNKDGIDDFLDEGDNGSDNGDDDDDGLFFSPEMQKGRKSEIKLQGLCNVNFT